MQELTDACGPSFLRAADRTRGGFPAWVGKLSNRSGVRQSSVYTFPYQVAGWAPNIDGKGGYSLESTSNFHANETLSHHRRKPWPPCVLCRSLVLKAPGRSWNGRYQSLVKDPYGSRSKLAASVTATR